MKPFRAQDKEDLELEERLAIALARFWSGNPTVKVYVETVEDHGLLYAAVRSNLHDGLPP